MYWSNELKCNFIPSASCLPLPTQIAVPKAGLLHVLARSQNLGNNVKIVNTMDCFTTKTKYSCVNELRPIAVFALKAVETRCNYGDMNWKRIFGLQRRERTYPIFFRVRDFRSLKWLLADLIRLIGPVSFQSLLLLTRLAANLTIFSSKNNQKKKKKMPD